MSVLQAGPPMYPVAQLYLRWRMNEARIANGLLPLRTSTELMAVAQRRSAAIATKFSQQSAGVPDQLWGEIIGWDSGITGRAATDYIVGLWLASPEHRAILLGRWTYIGAGLTVAGGRSWFVGYFGHP